MIIISLLKMLSFWVLLWITFSSLFYFYTVVVFPWFGKRPLQLTIDEVFFAMLLVSTTVVVLYLMLSNTILWP